MRIRQWYAVFALLFNLLFVPAAQAIPFTLTFTTQPAGGAVSGAPGDVVGWGYQLVNTDTDHWYVATALNVSSFSLGSPDASYFDFPILAPGAGAAAGFDPVSHTGLFGLQIFPFALPTQTETGTFGLVGEWWSGDPFAGGAFLQDADAIVVPLSLEVVQAGTVPLPGTAWLIALGGASLLASQRRRQKGVQFRGGLR
jgi:hypothetical protein